MSIGWDIMRRSAVPELSYASCEGFATEHGTALHLRPVPDGGYLYFGGGLADAHIASACGEVVNWDDHFYSQIELEATVERQGHGFHFCQACLDQLRFG